MTVKFIIKYLMIASFLAVLLSGCRYECYNHNGRNGYLEILKSFSAEKNERSEKFKSFSVSEQVEIYLFSKQCVEGENEVIDFIRYDGSKRISAILDRIKENPRSDEKVWLIEALVAINDDCICITQYSNALEILSKAETTMGDNDEEMTKIYKRIYSLNLSHIRERIELNTSANKK